MRKLSRLGSDPHHIHVLREWMLQREDEPEFTGSFLGVRFRQGVAKVRKKYFSDLLERQGCKVVDCKVIDPDWTPKRILIVRLGAFGDNLMVTSAIEGLKEKYPDAVIDSFGEISPLLEKVA